MTAAAAVERAVARVDLGAIERNCRRIRSLLAERSELCAVVKADGYGHGDVECARAALAGGATWLAVAAGDEAAALRAEGVDGRLLVMGALTGAEAATAAAAAAEVVAWDERFVEELGAAAAQSGHSLRVHVKLDTGMGRLGTKDPDAALSVCERVARHDSLELAGVMTHFATADEPGDDHFPAQLRAFREFAAAAKRLEPSLTVHAANSAAVFRERASHFDMARCGIAIYGLDPFGEDAAGRDLEPALELRSYVAEVKRFEPGESAGYGRRFVAQEPTNLATLPIGYGDGVRRALTNNAEVLVGGARRPLVGTVSMDNVTVDVGRPATVAEGDEAILIGTQGEQRITAEELARQLDTINYEITCGLLPRVPRAYHRDGEPA